MTTRPWPVKLDFNRDDRALHIAYDDGAAFRITLVQRSEILKPFTPKLRDYAAAQLRHRDVALRLGAGVQEVRKDSVILSDGTELASDLTVWATGVAPHEEVREWSLPLDDGDRIRVGEDLQVLGMPGVYAAGDVAATPQQLPQLAQPAIQGGAHVARQIQRLLAGEPTEPFDADVHRRDGAFAVRLGLHSVRGIGTGDEQPPSGLLASAASRIG